MPHAVRVSPDFPQVSMYAFPECTNAFENSTKCQPEQNMKRGEPKCHFGSPLKTIRYRSTGSLSFNRICNPVVCLYSGRLQICRNEIPSGLLTRTHLNLSSLKMQQMSDSPSRVLLQSFFEAVERLYHFRYFEHIGNSGMIESLARSLVE